MSVPAFLFLNFIAWLVFWPIGLAMTCYGLMWILGHIIVKFWAFLLGFGLGVLFFGGDD
jgi:hypothetical protein